ncbi:extracellular solute-binding protein [Paenibacillus qinlingensis]|uniref:Raffinose/stachyose/melibiose transport system substrate-binding protein n=1 Tax=Paenibacillus qinlingensis TaxID=1837343 RepID=A0ABU1P1B1_9BACL|nr:extracellular solute-binding protein [Paenibacillus qinlingensis]MDR6553527.1 raffinose/stachyose/melibiose transport system substrate-binding protein [Paenibacillus qinlingensis]
MKMTMRKPIYVLLASALAVGLTACSSSSTSTSGTTSGSDSAPVTLKYVSWMSKGEDKPILAEFMKKYPNIKVEDTVLDGQKYDQLLKTKFLAGDGPDVYLFMKSAQYASYVKEGWLMDVSNEPGTALQKQSKELSSYYTVDGKMYGSLVNGGGELWPIYYNKKYFDKLGIKPPTTPTEFYAISAKIKADGKEPVVFGGKDGWPFRIMFDPYRNAENFGKYPNYNDALYKGEVKPSDLYKNTFTEFGKWVSDGIVAKPSLTLTYDQSVQYFVDGKAAMIPQGPWLTGLDPIKNANKNDFELGAFVYNYAPVNGKLHLLGAADRSIGINAKTKHADAAKKLYNFFLEKENVTKYLESQGLTTLLPGVNVKVDAVLKPLMDLANDASKVEYHFTAGSVTFPPAWDSITWASYQNILAGQSVDSELKRVDAEFAKLKDQAIK